MPLWKRAVWTVVLFVFAPAILLKAVDKPFHDAPDSAKTEKNPYAGQETAITAGKTVYARNCLACHGRTLKDRKSVVVGKILYLGGGPFN